MASRARPRTVDPKHWAETHDAEGRVSAEGFLRGYTEGAWVGYVSMRLQLSDIAMAGPLRQVKYTLAVRDNITGEHTMQTFTTLRDARSGWQAAHVDALKLHAARVVGGVE